MRVEQIDVMGGGVDGARLHEVFVADVVGCPQGSGVYCDDVFDFARECADVADIHVVVLGADAELGGVRGDYGVAVLVELFYLINKPLGVIAR